MKLHINESERTKSDFIITTGNPLFKDYMVVRKYIGTDTDVVIPDGTKEIGANAFIDCKTLRSVTIPNSVTHINEQAFYNCVHLTTVIANGTIHYIGKSAFENCKRLRHIALDMSLDGNISQYAFKGCTSLTKSPINGRLPSHVDNNAFGDYPNDDKFYDKEDYGLTYAHSLVGDQIIDLFDSACETTDLSYRDEVLSGTGTVYFYDIDDYTEDNLLYSIDISDLRDTLAYIWKSCYGDEIDVENKIIDWLEDTVK